MDNEIELKKAINDFYDLNAAIWKKVIIPYATDEYDPYLIEQ